MSFCDEVNRPKTLLSVCVYELRTEESTWIRKPERTTSEGTNMWQSMQRVSLLWWRTFKTIVIR